MKKHWLLAILGIVFLGGVGIVVSHYATAASAERVGEPCDEKVRPSLGQLRHDKLDTLLKKYVDRNGMVAYAKWKAHAGDLAGLDAYLKQLGCVDVNAKSTKSARLVFWINAYNAVTLKGILEKYPTTSIRNHTARLIGYNIWRDLKLWVDGKHYSLDDMEHKILRKMDEPRIHFAVNCASISCPPLVHRAYTAKNLETMLTWNARRFFANPKNFRADPANRTIYVSTLLQWYGADFARTPQQQMRLLRPYFPNAKQLGWLDTTGFSVRYLNYDWNLNDQK